MRIPLLRRARGRGRAGVSVLAATLLAACSPADGPTGPSTSTLRLTDAWSSHTEATGYIRVCKSAGPTGTYTFETTVSGGGAHLVNFGSGPTLTLDFAGTEVCLNTYSQLDDPSWTAGLTSQVTVKELVPDGIEVAEIQVWNFGVFPAVLLETLSGPSSVTVTAHSTSQIKLFFFNRTTPPPPPPSAGQGCTPGYWKQKQHFDSWQGYLPSQALGSVFSNASIFGFQNHTLLQALSYSGGSRLSDAAQNLLRASVAAILNSAHDNVSYALTTASIVSQVNAALASGSRDAMLGLKDTLDRENNMGCGLN